MRKVKSISLMISVLMITLLTLMMAVPLVSAQDADSTTEDVDLGAQYIGPSQQLMVQKVTITDGGTSDGLPTLIDAFTVTNTGTASDNQVSSLSLWKDDGDGVFDPAIDAQIGSTVTNPTMKAGQLVGTNNNVADLIIADGESEVVLVVVTLATDATKDGKTLVTELDSTDLVGTGSTRFAPEEGTETATSETTLDTVAPTYDSAITGDVAAGDSSATNKVYLSFTETKSGLDSATVEASDFTVTGATVDSIDSPIGSDVVILILDSELATDATPDVALKSGENIKDKAGNVLEGPVSHTASDGLQPTVNSVTYVEGTNELGETLTVGFSEVISIVGVTGDYTVNYDPGDANRVVAVEDVSGLGTTVELKIVDQSQEADYGKGFKVTVTTPADVLDSGGNGVNSLNAEATSETVVAFDTVSPTFVSAKATGDTTIDIVFNEPISIVGGISDWGTAVTAAGITATGATVSPTTTLSVTVEPLGDTAFTASDLAIAADTVEDTAGNKNAAISGKTIDDGQVPTMDSAKTKTTTSIDVTFSEDLNGDTVDEGDFTVAGPIAVTEATLGDTDNIVTLTLETEIDTSAIPDVTYNQGILADPAGNKVETDTVTPDDGIGPVLLSVTWDDVDSDDEVDEMDTLEFTFSEAMDTTTITAANVDTALPVTRGGATYGTGPKVEWSGNTVTVTLAYNEDIVLGDTVTPADTVTDSAENPATGTVTIGMDIAPTVSSAVTEDRDFNGYIDAILITFDKPVDEATAIAAGFDVKGYTGEAIETGENLIDDMVRITFAENQLHDPDTDAKPPIDIAYGAIKGVDHVPIAEDLNHATTDGAKPVLLHAEIDAAESDGDATSLDLTFSEPVTNVDNGVDVTIDGIDYDIIPIAPAETLRVDLLVVLQTGDCPEITAIDLSGALTDGTPANHPVLKDNENVVVNTLQRTLDAGWNYVSLPIADRHEYDIGDYFSDAAKVGVVWTYAEGTWICYDPDIDPADKVKVKGGFGYLVDIKSDQTLPIAPNVYNVATGEYPVGLPADRSVSTGWNLIGHYQEFDQLADSDQAFKNLTINFTTVYGISDGQLVSVSEMHAGYAYWAFADADGIYAEGSDVGTGTA